MGSSEIRSLPVYRSEKCSVWETLHYGTLVWEWSMLLKNYHCYNFHNCSGVISSVRQVNEHLTGTEIPLSYLWSTKYQEGYFVESTETSLLVHPLQSTDPKVFRLRNYALSSLNEGVFHVAENLPMVKILLTAVQ